MIWPYTHTRLGEREIQMRLEIAPITDLAFETGSISKTPKWHTPYTAAKKTLSPRKSYHDRHAHKGTRYTRARNVAGGFSIWTSDNVSICTAIEGTKTCVSPFKRHKLWLLLCWWRYGSAPIDSNKLFTYYGVLCMWMAECVWVANVHCYFVHISSVFLVFVIRFSWNSRLGRLLFVIRFRLDCSPYKPTLPFCLFSLFSPSNLPPYSVCFHIDF